MHVELTIYGLKNIKQYAKGGVKKAKVQLKTNDRVKTQLKKTL